MSPADVLEAAADALFVHGRAIGSGEDDEGRMCVEGAICFVQGIDPWDWATAHTEATSALKRYIRDAPCHWNDGLPRTPLNDAHIIDTLLRCAKALREVEAP